MIRGAPDDLVASARLQELALPGGRGFAGWHEGALVRDVLGRQPLFVERPLLEEGGVEWPRNGPGWGHDPTAIRNAVPFPAGSISARPGHLESRWSLPTPAPATDRGSILDELDRTLLATCEGTVPDDAAVAFSGGVDSALLAALLDRPAYVVGFPESPDLQRAQRVADDLDVALTVRELDHDALRDHVRRVANRSPHTSAMDLAIGATFSAVGTAVSADGHETLVLGQGADELFGGYEKVAQLDGRVDADTPRDAVRELLGSLPTQFERDVPVLRAAGVEPLSPYLDDAVVDVALRLPEPLLVDGTRRKVALRTVAARHLPGELAETEKAAAQYGSRVARELDRLARQAGYKRREDDHVERYVREELLGGP